MSSLKKSMMEEQKESREKMLEELKSSKEEIKYPQGKIEDLETAMKTLTTNAQALPKKTEDSANIRQAAKFVKDGSVTCAGKIPPLQDATGATTRDASEQMDVLPSTFFSPLPNLIQEEEVRPYRVAPASASV
ncbi:hypothetical protein SEPCBS119000_003418 [Sporothrix epigloea]|uniref:Tubulin-specific chaperone A n=1 Tax=Sporothrix epigloea TaxID=1892477 RepID=A0ABP0DLR7_9PEZI